MHSKQRRGGIVAVTTRSTEKCFVELVTLVLNLTSGPEAAKHEEAQTLLNLTRMSPTLVTIHTSATKLIFILSRVEFYSLLNPKGTGGQILSDRETTLNGWMDGRMSEL